ncbi:LapA family protein [Amycolatopsis minnesotensis]|uniref:LapA family protein n=1 Tax=Amycolatopsis minnesotensis TaxID=337894 RepID=A0ABP5BEM6_9PSEU
MLWLFGQIWLWLLIAFALGALVTGLLVNAANRKRERRAAEPEEARRVSAPSPAHDEHGYRDVPYDQEADHFPAARGEEVWPDDPDEPDPGRREGTLPGFENVPHEDWPRESGTPAWPGDDDWPPAGPGRGR